MVSHWFHMVSHGFTLVSQGFAGFHRVSHSFA
jgi:hypothetical protein